MSRPGDLAAVVGKFLWRAQVIELVVVSLCGVALTLEQGQRFEGARLI